MKNFVSEGLSLDLVAPSGGVVSGAGVKFGSLIVIPSVTVAQGVAFAGRVRGIFTHPAAGSQAWTAGTTVLYWDDTNKVFTSTSSGNTKCGVAGADKASADTVGAVLLIPSI